MADPLGRLARIRRGLSPAEWTRVGAMAAYRRRAQRRWLGNAGRRAGRSLPHRQDEVFGVGTGVLAYTLGMRHAFDADHIAAIDNTTRKLISDGKRPLSVGYFFSLGHSTVVFVLAVLFNVGIRASTSR